jgi:hypothetical protein
MTTTFTPVRRTDQEDDLYRLARDLTCAVGMVVRIDRVITFRAVERCVSARSRAQCGEYKLVPRSGHCVEVWWTEGAGKLKHIGSGVTLDEILRLTRRVEVRPPDEPMRLGDIHPSRASLSQPERFVA